MEEPRPRAARRARGPAGDGPGGASPERASPRVIALERLDPPRVGGFWIPEMISIAGGEDVAGDPGLNPAEVGWGELASLNAEVVIVMPDGSVEDAHAQAMEHWERIAALGATRVFAVDAAAAFAEPGPRLVDGVELLGHLLHPDLIDPPGNTAFRRCRRRCRGPRAAADAQATARAPSDRDDARPAPSPRTRRRAGSARASRARRRRSPARR